MQNMKKGVTSSYGAYFAECGIAKVQKKGRPMTGGPRVLIIIDE
jgi:hypothetical protein